LSAVSFDRVLDKINDELGESLVFAGALDNNAKLLSFRKGTGKFSLPVERHDTLDVQISLLFSLLRQLEDISGSHRFTLTRFGKYDFFLFGTSDIHLFVVSVPEPADKISQVVSDLASEMVEGPPPVMPRREQVITASPVSTRSSSDFPRSEKHQPEKHQHLASSSSRKSRPDPVVMLQGYLMGIESGLIIEEDSEGYKITTDDPENHRLPWAMIERINATFGSKVDLTFIERDRDGRIALRLTPKE
jgi:hypothetical protein